MQSTLKNLRNLATSMLQRRELIMLLLVVVVIFLMVEPAYAGPGGYVAKGLFKTWWGKLLIFALVIIFLPFILYIRFREYLAVRKNKKILLKLGSINHDLSWSYLEKNVKNVFTRVYIAWSRGNMEEVSNYVSSWYWQNQQLVILDEWKNNNLKNVCHLQCVGKITPLHLEITDDENFEGSRIAFSISAYVEDYMINLETGNVVHGRKGFQDEEKVWFLEYTNGNWLLDDIQEGTYSLAYAKLKNILPEQLPTKAGSRKIPSA